jgi:hypothetical protein
MRLIGIRFIIKARLWLFLGTLASVTAGAGCSSQSLVRADGAVDHPAVTPPDAVGEQTIVADAHQTPPDAQTSPPTGVVFPDPAPAACAADGGAGACDFPPSACGVAGCTDAGICPPAIWMASYSNPRCVNGGCVWDRLYYQCSGYATSCLQGACFYNGTTLP